MDRDAIIEKVERVRLLAERPKGYAPSVADWKDYAIEDPRTFRVMVGGRKDDGAIRLSFDQAMRRLGYRPARSYPRKKLRTGGARSMTAAFWREKYYELVRERDGLTSDSVLEAAGQTVIAP